VAPTAKITPTVTNIRPDQKSRWLFIFIREPFIAVNSRPILGIDLNRARLVCT
jgi:hypothetical protein